MQSVNYYVMNFDSIVEDYIDIDSEQFSKIETACLSSEFHRIPLSDMVVYTSDNGGIVFPDFYYNGFVPLFSEKLYEILKNNTSDNMIFRKVKVISDVMNTSKEYMLGLPETIRCIDKNKSIYSEVYINDYVKYMDIEKLVIDDKKTGFYDIFKIADTFDTNIYVTEKLKELLQQTNPIGVSFFKYDVEY